MKKYEEIIQRIKDAGVGFHANDNITKFIDEGEKEQLINELTEKFEGVLDAHSSLTQTTVLKGAFYDDHSTKKEFMDNIKLQQGYAN